MSRNTKSGLFVGAILVGIAVVFHQISSNQQPLSCQSLKETLEIPTQGYNSSRTGSVQSCFDPSQELKSELLPDSQGAVEAQPLLVQYKNEPQLIFLTQKQVKFWGTQSEKYLKSIDLDQTADNINSSAMVISRKFGKLYGIYHQTDEKKKIHNRLFEVSLRNNQIRYLDLPFAQILKTPEVENVLRCRTSMALAEESRLSFGCSLGLEWPFYSKKPGIQGLFATVFLDANGNIPTDWRKIQFFYPDGTNGQDSSVWMSGSAAAVLPNGNFVFTTGNGKIEPGKHHFGCSLLQLDKTGKELARKGKAIIPYFEEPEIYSAADGLRMCEQSDMDLSGSGVAVAKDGDGKIWLGLSGKDSTFRVYSESSFYRQEKHFSHQMSDVNWGQPVVWQQPSGVISWISVVYNTKDGWKATRFDQSASGGSIKEVWMVSGEGLLDRSSPVIAHSENGAASILFTAKANEESKLIVLGFTSGEVKKTIAIPGETHFSMPVVFADQIYLSVRGKGIVKVYSPK